MKRKNPVKRRSALASAMATVLFRKRVIPSKKLYSRKGRKDHNNVH